MTVVDKLGRCEKSGLWATFVVSTPDFTFIKRERDQKRTGCRQDSLPGADTASPECARASTEACDYRSTKMIVMIIMVIIITKQLS